MQYFGSLKHELIENLDNSKIADILIQNNFFIRPVEKEYIFTDDIFAIDIAEKTKISKSTKKFILTLIEFMKLLPKQMEIQLKKDLYKIINIGGENKIDLNNFLIDDGINIYLEPTQNLLDDFYDTIINHFRLIILDNKFSFYEIFNEEIFGLDFNEQKRIALKRYKSSYKNIFYDGITYLSVDDYEDDNFKIDYLKIDNKLKMVYVNKLKYQNKLLKIDSIFKYLTGDESLFRESFYKKNCKVLDEIINYEVQKEIMVELNTKYKFEEDFYFSNTLDDKRNFLDYNKIFNSFKAFKFTNVNIQNFGSDKKAQVESLYEFLRVNNLINKGKIEFLRFLEIEHGIVITKIISYINYDNRKDFPNGGKKPNDAHIKRVQILDEKWTRFE